MNMVQSYQKVKKYMDVAQAHILTYKMVVLMLIIYYYQRGVVSEDEANFIAFVVCTSSDDAFLRYAGYLDVYQNVVSALYTASPELWEKLNEKVPREVRGEFNAYAVFFDKYRDNVAADVTESVNNSYIENHNQPAGVKSYGMVVDLVVSYMLYENK